ncbi:MAG: hypothetical protein FWB95_08880 [Treponema sp.]|nr:hypothetical protein [Treponema sp.]
MPRYIIGGPAGRQNAVHASHERHFTAGTPPEISEHTLNKDVKWMSRFISPMCFFTAPSFLNYLGEC